MNQQDVAERKQTTTEVIDIIADLGNKSYKLIANDKKIIDCSNAQEVSAGTFGAFVINGKHYIIGENAKSKKNTNKICESKKAVLGRALYPLVADKAKVDITTLLPLSLYVNEENKRKYSDLLKGKYTVSNANGATKTFTVSKVDVCAESFSSLLTNRALLDHPLYLVDIGGVDTTGVFVHKTPDINSSFISEKGMNIFFTELGRVLTSKLTDSYTEKDAELVFEKYNDLEDSLKAIIDEFATTYVNTNIYEPLKEIGFKSLIHKLVFVGGGSKALERYLVKLENAQVLENALWSNVEGAQRLSILRGK
ncbi:MAG: ParM/StbA family protein [Clostridium sp.]|nr:ParM/StbA family protein [Clostridium sp.]